MSVVPMSKMLEDSYAEIAKKLPQDKRARIIAKMKQNVRVDVVERIAIDSMVKTFTAEELNALADFYGSKPGRSATQKFGIYMMGPASSPQSKRRFSEHFNSRVIKNDATKIQLAASSTLSL